MLIVRPKPKTDHFVPTMTHGKTNRLQFSVRSLLFATAAAALFLAIFSPMLIARWQEYRRLRDFERKFDQLLKEIDFDSLQIKSDPI
ncbi:hypothetical protein CGZ80_19895 [Rhodopirellula sp. MGV]|nr:hypothetical protein CGZ80_19895 [Rhodopirellula sp. MGV]PNY35885.1 hypothetical protein C2E31_15590 [Rhodopirellula baltica]